MDFLAEFLPEGGFGWKASADAFVLEFRLPSAFKDLSPPGHNILYMDSISPREIGSQTALFSGDKPSGKQTANPKNAGNRV